MLKRLSFKAIFSGKVSRDVILRFKVVQQGYNSRHIFKDNNLKIKYFRIMLKENI